MNSVIPRSLIQKVVEHTLKFIPFLFVVQTISNVFYLSFISIFPSLLIRTLPIVSAHIAFFVVSFALVWRYRSFFEVRIPRLRSLALLIPILIIIFMRAPMLYPTLDDLAVHFMYGDMANTLWHNVNVVPLNFLTYFYLVLDMNYTPFLYTLGIRLTILIFDLVASLWLYSIFLRLKGTVKNDVQRLLLDVIFLMTPFIPHVMATMGTLMTDYITIPIGLEALYLFLRKDKDKTFAVHMTILLVLAKLSPATFVILPFLYFFVLNIRKIRWSEVFVLCGIVSLYFIRQYVETGSPLFGLYNGIFKSPLYPLDNFSNPLFGPRNWFEFLSWPVIAQFTERYAEGVVTTYAKLFFAPIPMLGYVISCVFCIKKRSTKYGLVVASYMIWSYLTGYARYFMLLNVMTLVFLVIDFSRVPSIVQRILHYKMFILLPIAMLSFTSMKTDFSWRPFPSFTTPGATAYFADKYLEGLKFVGRDTIPNMSAYYADMFERYDAVATSYRGASTFIAYLANLQGLPMISEVTATQYENILTSSKVGSQIKQNLKEIHSAERVLLLSDHAFDQVISSLYISQTHACSTLGNGTRFQYFQRDFFFQDLSLYSCEKGSL